MQKYLLPIVFNNRRAAILPLLTTPATPSTIMLDCDTHKLTLIHIAKSKMLQSLCLGASDVLLKNLNYNFNISDVNATLTVNTNAQVVNTMLGQTANITNNIDDDDDDDFDFAPKPKNILQSNTQQHVFTLTNFDNAQLVYNDSETAITLSLILSDALRATYLLSNVITLNIILNINNVTFSNVTNFVIATQASLLNVGFDFGSEASQIRQRRYKKAGPDLQTNLTDVPLFNCVKAFKNETSNDEAYFQYEKDTPFLKSVFYVKKKLQANNEAYEEQDFLTTDDELLIINKTQEAFGSFDDTWKQLPNLKIAHKYGSLLLNYKLNLQFNNLTRVILLNDVKDKLYGTILKNILAAYFSNAVYNSNAIDLKITLLIPNIYDTFEIKRTAYIVADIIAAINANVLNGKIRHYELITLSESDASFMGYYNLTEQFVEKNKYYTIIDCGKGTTDFSIVQSDDSNIHEFKNLYRNGFAGAGNFLTYAFFEAFFYYVIEVANNRANAKLFLSTILPNFSGPDKQRLFNIVEQYKINYKVENLQANIEAEFMQVKSGNITFKNLFDAGENINIETLFDLMLKCTTCYNWGSNITNAIDSIIFGITGNIEKVIATLNDKKIECGGVLITGRGFLFKPLQQALITAFKKLGINEALIKFPKTNKEFKTICLNGIFRTSYTFNPDMMCLPIELLPKVNTAQQINAPIPEPLQQKSTGLLNKVKLFFQKQVNDIVLGDIQKFSEDVNTMNVKQSDFAKLRFIIGNYTYEPDNYFINQGDRKELVYDGSGFVLRCFTKNTIVDFCGIKKLEELTSNNIAQIMPSLFPAILDKDNFDFLTANYKKIISDEDDIFMPK